MLSTSSDPNVYPPPENTLDRCVSSGSGSSARSLSARERRSRMSPRPPERSGGPLSGFCTFIPLEKRAVSWVIAIAMLRDVPSFATSKVVLGFVIAVVAVITESSETACAAAMRKEIQIRNYCGCKLCPWRGSPSSSSSSSQTADAADARV